MHQAELYGRTIRVNAAKERKDASQQLGARTAVWEQVRLVTLKYWSFRSKLGNVSKSLLHVLHHVGRTPHLHLAQLTIGGNRRVTRRSMGVQKGKVKRMGTKT